VPGGGKNDLRGAAFKKIPGGSFPSTSGAYVFANVTGRGLILQYLSLLTLT